MTDKPELMGVAEVAALVGVEPATVRTWRARQARGAAMRHPLPEPDWIISGVPIWLSETIRAWADQRAA